FEVKVKEVAAPVDAEADDAFAEKLGIESLDKMKELLRENIVAHLDQLPDGQQVMLKLSIPTEVGLYDRLAEHPRVIRVVALSGGYSTDEACEKLAKQPKMIASFSRALAEGLFKQQSDEEFNAALGSNIDKIYQASI
ncbi:MAG: fructose bisphosphate aldolase, partial [Sagittula sp.]